MVGAVLEKFELPKKQEHDSMAKKMGRTYLAPLFLRTRCPHCQKPYRIDTRDIKSSEPHFGCNVCESTFSFVYPPKNPLNVEAKLLQASLLPSPATAERRPMDVKACPKCLVLNAKGAAECGSCGVIFARMDALPLDSKMGALPSLVKAWKDLMSDYDNVKKHVAFVHRCEELHAIPYALKKYRDLKEVQPQDQIADEMLHRVLGRRLARPAGWVMENRAFKEVNARIHWVRIRKLAPWAISALLIVLGLGDSNLKNLAGIGASILFITIGLHLFFKGRIELSDFW